MRKIILGIFLGIFFSLLGLFIIIWKTTSYYSLYLYLGIFLNIVAVVLLTKYITALIIYKNKELVIIVIVISLIKIKKLINWLLSQLIGFFGFTFRK
jgi:hypothetical protein